MNKTKQETGKWLYKREYMAATGLSSGTLDGYAYTKRVKSRGGNRTGRKREFYYDPPEGGRMRVRKAPIDTGTSTEIVGIPPCPTTKAESCYWASKRTKNLAWLAVKCFREELSFSVELDKIVGAYREQL